jgi:large subunit ribosomal protein L30
MTLLAIIRIRGSVKVNVNLERTMKLMGLKAVNNCAIVPKDETHIGMVKKIREMTTYGEIDKDVFMKMLLKRGETLEGKKVTEDLAKKVDVEKLFNNETTLRKAGIRPCFRLHPPRKGYEGIKRQYNQGGALGNRAAEINILLRRMI